MWEVLYDILTEFGVPAELVRLIKIYSYEATNVHKMNSYILHTHCSGFGRICSNLISPLAFADMTS
jgi:hypothetical protein